MGQITAIDEKTNRKFFIDDPDDLKQNEPVTFLLSLHGGGSVGHWQREYFPAYDYRNQHRLAIATPSCATKEPMRHWVAEADDEHLRNIVNMMFDKYNVHSFWLVGHSQGGMTSNRLLKDKFFSDRVDGWLSLSGGRIGPIEIPESFFAPFGGRRPALPSSDSDAPRPGRATTPDADISFIFTTGEHEMVRLPETSPWAEKYGCGSRVRLPDIVDSEPGKIYDTTRDGKSSPGWGLRPRPGTAEVYMYPGGRDGRIVADIVRLDKGHTEGLEPKVTGELVKMIVSARGGKANAL